MFSRKQHFWTSIWTNICGTRKKNLTNYLKVINAFSPKISNLPGFRRDDNSKAKVEGKRQYLYFKVLTLRSFGSQQTPSSFWAFIKQSLNVTVWGDTKSGFNMIWKQMDISHTLLLCIFHAGTLQTHQHGSAAKKMQNQGSNMKGFISPY